jgi:ubiquinone/menaquinone biosynthesis C-methylase UbiE
MPTLRRAPRDSLANRPGSRDGPDMQVPLATRLKPIVVLRRCRLAGLLWFLAGLVAAQDAGHYEFRTEHDPNGIGKFYFGREIARVMGHEGADWLERPQRAEEEQTDRLVNALKIKPGDVIADIGAGTGYVSRRLARLTGPGGKVLAEDIQPEMLQLLTNNMARFGITNVFPVLGTVVSPRLPPASLDLVVMVDVYHEFEFPYEMVQGICHALKPGGRVAFVEYRREDPNVPIKLLHKMTEAQVKKEMSVQPLRWVETIEVLPRQHIIIFTKTASQARPRRDEK